MRRTVIILAVLFTVAPLVSPRVVSGAAGITSCEVGKSCTVGEFLYNDSYTPITTATCTLTSRYPDGTSYLSSQSLTSTSDGWYAYTFTTPSTTGTYRSQICCTAGSDYMCLDKSFNVVSASSSLTATDVTNAVWDATRSAHTTSGSFGESLQNVVPASADVASATWNYSSRSLSTFGNLVGDIWGNSSRTLTSFGDFVTNVWGGVTGKQTTADIAALKASTQETRNLLEQVVNKPVVETSTEETPELESKIQETEATLDQLFADVSAAGSQVDLIKLRWWGVDDSEALAAVDNLTSKLGGENDQAGTKSIFGQVAYLSDSWDWTPVTSAKTQTRAVRDVLVALGQELESSGKSGTAYGQVKALAGLLGQLDSIVGAAGDKKDQRTLFGKLAEVKFLAATFSGQSQDLTAVLGSWDSSSVGSRQRKLDELATSIAKVNRIPAVAASLSYVPPATDKDMRNKSYYLSAIVTANQRLLAAKAGQSLSNTWLELGSIVFKSLVTNPSALISQKVTVKYYLPPEVKKEDIISVDSGLTVKYDTEKDQNFVSGEFLLAPSETRTVAVRVSDVWQITPEEVESLRKQAAALATPLTGTAYFAQGVTLKSDIDAALDRVLLLAKANSTPENKIRSYREAEIEMKAVRTELDKMKELAASAGSVGTIFGFVGGAQALAVWGLILILAVGFVFLALYMKVLIRKEQLAVIPVKAGRKRPIPEVNSEDFGRHPSNWGLAAILALTLGIGILAGLALGRMGASSSQVLGQTTANELKK